MENNFENLTLANKLTLNVLGLDKPTLQALVEGTKGPIEVANFIGYVEKFTEKASTTNPANMDTKFIGNFEGTNVQDGTMARSSAMYLPSIGTEFLKKVMEKSVPGETTGVVFTITVQKDPAPGSATGYKFGMTAVSDKSAADPFESLRGKLAASKQKALSAPAKKK